MKENKDKKLDKIDQNNNEQNNDHNHNNEKYDDYEPAGFERIVRQRPHKQERQDKKMRRPNRQGKPLW